MSKSWDLRASLAAWPYDPDDDARIVRGDDGREILQVRTPLGIEQYELEGRPDADRPHGMESALEFYEGRLRQAEAEGSAADFKLDSDECAELFNEGTLYYFRYLRLFQLKDWRRTVQDTSRNLRAFDFVHRHAEREADRLFLEKWRPYILRVNGTAQGMLQLEQGNFGQALNTIRETIDRIRALEDMDDETFRFEFQRSLDALSDLGAQIEKKRPRSDLERLEEDLRRAIDRQEFERAATLRDRIRALRKQQQVC